MCIRDRDYRNVSHSPKIFRIPHFFGSGFYFFFRFTDFHLCPFLFVTGLCFLSLIHISQFFSAPLPKYCVWCNLHLCSLSGRYKRLFSSPYTDLPLSLIHICFTPLSVGASGNRAILSDSRVTPFTDVYKRQI